MGGGWPPNPLGPQRERRTGAQRFLERRRRRRGREEPAGALAQAGGEKSLRDGFGKAGPARRFAGKSKGEWRSRPPEQRQQWRRGTGQGWNLREARNDRSASGDTGRTRKRRTAALPLLNAEGAARTIGGEDRASRMWVWARDLPGPRSAASPARCRRIAANSFAVMWNPAG